ncbi:putative inorganic carbon transporter subunit DabA [Actinokineospora sp. NPDC004072]
MIEKLVDHAAELLPTQGPLQAFVHHNTLHAFESMEFTDAIAAASQLYGTEPYQSEDAFHDLLRQGRITTADIDAVVADEVDDGGRPVIPGGPNRSLFHCERLHHRVDVPDARQIPWLLAETDLLTTITPLASPTRRAALTGVDLGAMWQHLAVVAPERATRAPGARPRDRLLAATGADADHLVHPVLIRFTAAFLDQGVAHWPMPARERGLLAAFRALYGQGAAPARFLRGLSATLADQRSWDAVATIRWALGELGVVEAEWPEVVQDTLLSLPGWAGMVRHLELRPDNAPVAAPPARLTDYLAVQLVLDVFAARSVAALPHLPVPEPGPDLALVHEAFVLAQVMPVDTDLLADPRHAAAWLGAVAEFDGLRRRRLLHLAYERRHQEDVLGCLAAHRRLARPAQAPAWQAVFCLDEREESLRRHLEEIAPEVATFGAAGFFGVAMRYRGLRDVRDRPLCPVVITPTKSVVEVADATPRATLRARWRRHLHVGTRTLGRGGLLTVALGLGHAAALVARCLFPALAHRLFDRQAAPPRTRLAIEPEFSVAEMAAIVAGITRTTGLAAGFTPLVLIVGHGSTSMNNPHESAHDCGATGGGRGGPNARAFAAMANHPAVRDRLRESGVDIPEGTWFVGAYHNTADDTVVYYDTDLVPPERAADLDRARAALSAACAADAHERCRRFESAPQDLPEERAIGHVLRHSIDLSQPRPEYGHATNAVCIVGERSLTRGLFLDRRAFLISYDGEADVHHDLLDALLRAAGPVCAGINLEYYFSFVDPIGYGCGTKLPHNVVGLIGVMDGHASDLRTGLPWQMVEIHEPVRLLLVVRTTPTRLLDICLRDPDLARLVGNGWIRLVAWNPDDDKMHLFTDGGFTPYTPSDVTLPVVDRSRSAYAGNRGPVGCAHVLAAQPTPALDGAS